MKQQRRENMPKEFEKLNMGFLHHLSSQPLVVYMAREATTFYKRLADELSRKQDKQYSLVMGWIRCRLSFDLLSSAFEEVDPLATAQSVSSTLNLPLQRDMFPLTFNITHEESQPPAIMANTHLSSQDL